MRAIMAIFSFFMIFCCCGLLGTPLEQSEASFRWRTNSLETAAEDDPELNEEVQEKLADFRTRFQALPEDPEAREAGVNALVEEVKTYRKSVDSRLASRRDALASEHQARMDKIRPTLNGHWTGPGVTLTIDPGGQVSYERKSGISTTSVDLPLSSFGDDFFEVGLFGMTTRFEVQQLPHQVDGEWRMTVEGVELTRQ